MPDITHTRFQVPVTFQPSTVTGGGAPQDITHTRFDVPVSFFSPTVTVGAPALTISHSRFDVPVVFQSPTVTIGAPALTISHTRFSVPVTFPTPSVIVGSPGGGGGTAQAPQGVSRLPYPLIVKPDGSVDPVGVQANFDALLKRLTDGS